MPSPTPEERPIGRVSKEAERRCSLVRSSGARLLRREMRDHLFAQKADRVHDLLMRRRADRAQQDHLFNAHCLINLDKADAFPGGADAELCALFAYFGG